MEGQCVLGGQVHDKQIAFSIQMTTQSTISLKFPIVNGEKNQLKVARC
jgi:hypothetical protein